MRRLLRDVAEGRDLGDTTTLADAGVVDEIRERAADDAAGGLTRSCAWPRTSTIPDNWRWRAGPVAPGPAVVFDMDGVLSDAAGRQHFLERPCRDWEAFFEACGDDPLIDEVARLLDVIDRRPRIVLLTARPIRVQAPDPRPGSSATSCAGTCWSCATSATTGRRASSSGAAVAELRALRLRPAPRVRGRPPQRPHVPRRGRALRLHPLAATTTESRALLVAGPASPILVRVAGAAPLRCAALGSCRRASEDGFSRGSSRTAEGCRSRLP